MVYRVVCHTFKTSERVDSFLMQYCNLYCLWERILIYVGGRCEIQRLLLNIIFLFLLN